MELSHGLKASDIDERIKVELWKNIWDHYEYVRDGDRFIKYRDRDFLIQGIPTPWQTIAWKTLIRLMGEEQFQSLPRVLYYKEDPDLKVIIEDEFNDYFDDFANPEKLEVTFACGYFWKFNPKRREKMLDFVVDRLLNRGTTVTIWTQDDSLEEAFYKKRTEKPSDSTRGKLNFHCVRDRIEVHYTLIEDNTNWKNSRLFLELPHTEAHDFKLEIPLTFETLESFGCKPKKIMKALKRNITCWYRPHPIKKFLSRRNLALNWLLYRQ